MYKKVPIIAYILFKYGNFSKPFLNIVKEEKLPKEWKYYFLAQQYKWIGDYKRGLEFIEKALGETKENVTLYYLLLADKLSFMRLLQIPLAENIFHELRRDFFKIPILARKIIVPTIWSYFINRISREKISKIRSWSKEYLEDISTHLFILYHKGNEEAQKGNLKKAIKNYFQGVKIAKKIPHPTGLIYCLNNSSWYLKDKHPLFALNLAYKSVYFLGYYRENIESGFFALDTLLEIQKRVKDENIWDNIEIICEIYEKLPEGSGWGTKEHYKCNKDYCKNKKSILDIDMYENSEDLRNFLRFLFKDKNLTKVSAELGITKTNLSKLLRGWTLRVKGETIKKFLDKYISKIDFLNAPFPIVNEYLKERIRIRYFEESRDNFINLKPEERLIKFTVTYMSLTNRTYFQKKIRLKELLEMIENNIQNFEKIIEKDLKLMDFINKIFKAHPIIEARKDLIYKFINSLPKKRKREFINKYVELTEQEKSLVDIFIRNYERYNKKWEININIKDIPEEFLKKYNLKKMPLILALYSIDKKHQRSKLINILNKKML